MHFLNRIYDGGRQIFICLLLVLVFVCSGCLFAEGGEQDMPEEASDKGVEIINYNSQGEKVAEVFAAPPRRVVAIWQNNVHTTLALGAGDRIVAAVGVPFEECLRPEYREAYRKIPVRQMEMPGVENILMLEPELIAGWASTFTERVTKTTEFWQGRGIRTYMPYSSIGRGQVRRIEDEYNYILDFGRIFGREAQAEGLVARMRQEIDFVQSNTRGQPKPRTAILEKQGMQFLVYGENSLAGDILRHVNGELVALGSSASYEQLIEADPEVIFLVVSESMYRYADEIAADMLANPALQGVAAIRGRRIYVIPLYMVYSSATRTYDGICRMAGGLYPDLYEGRLPE